MKEIIIFICGIAVYATKGEKRKAIIAYEKRFQ